MKKSIIKIAIQILIIIAIIMIPFVWITIAYETDTGNVITNKEMVINITDEEVDVVEEFDIEIGKNTTEISLNEILPVISSTTEIDLLEIDGKEAKPYWKYTFRNVTGKAMTKHVKVSYPIGIYDITQYTDLAVFHLEFCTNDIDYVENIDMTIHFPEPTQLFEVESGIFSGNVAIDQLSDTEYQLHINKVSPIRNNELNIMFDNTITEVGEEENESYRLQEEKENRQFLRENHYPLILSISVCLTLTFYILYFIWKLKKQKAENIRREWQDLVTPVLAETIIDGEVGTKELIMTVITDLVTRGNIEIIDNETIHLIHKNDLAKYEKEVINLLFEDKTYIQFSQLKDVYIKLNSKTREIYIDIGKIKNDIIEELTIKGILSQKKKKIMSILRGILVINIVIMILTVSGLISDRETSAYVLVTTLVILVVVGSSKSKTAIEKVDKINSLKDDSVKLKLTMIMFGILMVLGILLNIRKAPVWNLIFMIIILLDLLFVFMTKKQFLTRKGKEERRKILELKKYIEEYSIMEERDLQDTILWDKYLAYATAFGIPNKVTKKVYEEYMNANILLQTIEKIIKIL